MLRPDLCGYGEAYIVMKRTVDLLAADANENDKSEQELAFKNTTPFTQCISNISNTLIDITEDLDIVILMHNLVEHSYIYFMTSEACGSIIETKSMMLILMIMLEIVNYLIIQQKQQEKHQKDHHKLKTQEKHTNQHNYQQHPETQKSLIHSNTFAIF